MGFVARGIAVALVVAYPLVVFFGLRFFTPREVAIAVGIVFAIRLVAVFASPQRLDVNANIAFTAALGVPVLAALFLNDELALRLVPALVNFAMLVTFGVTLRGVPIIERFAAMVDPDLTDAKKRHCRQFTVLWCVYFFVNGLVCAALAFGPQPLWVFHTGLLSYLLMGLLFAAEFVVRRHRFRQFSNTAVDRVLERLMSGANR